MGYVEDRVCMNRSTARLMGNSRSQHLRMNPTGSSGGGFLSNSLPYAYINGHLPAGGRMPGTQNITSFSHIHVYVSRWLAAWSYKDWDARCLVLCFPFIVICAP